MIEIIAKPICFDKFLSGAKTYDVRSKYSMDGTSKGIEVGKTICYTKEGSEEKLIVEVKDVLDISNLREKETRSRGLVVFGFTRKEYWNEEKCIGYF